MNQNIINIHPLIVILLLSLIHVNISYYLPGVSPKSFQPGDGVTLKANKVISNKTPLQYDYYDLPFCKRRRVRSRAENLGERISGDSTTTSPYELRMKKDVACMVLCRKIYRKTEINFFKEVIDNDYRVHWFLDNLPVAVRNDEQQYVSRGFPIGFKSTLPSNNKVQHFLFNHVRILVKYNDDDSTEADPGTRIVGFEVVPFSIKHDYERDGIFNKDTTSLKTCNNFNPAQYNPSNFQTIEQSEEEVIFTYDVIWERSDIKWANRWDIYLKSNPNDEIHYFAIVNSLMVVLFLSAVVAMIFLRTLHKDISSYNEMQTLEEAQEESGWKLVHGDVFRPPAFSPMLLSVLVGSGAQIIAMTLCTMVCALFGLTSPSNRGALLTTLLLLYVFMGSFAGYFSARIYKLCNGKEWKKNTILTATLYPGIMATIFLLTNIFVAVSGSSTAAPFSTLLALMLLWFGVSTPLVFVGSYFGFRKDTISTPVRTNQIARHIPEQVWYTHPAFSIALGGILPFGAVCIELFFVMSAIWLHHVYLVFGFLFVVFLILIITCAEITMVMCYFQLCNEDYRWWWKSFLSAGSSGGYLFLYSIWYLISKLQIRGFLSLSLYFAYMSMVSITFFILTGSIGFFSCLWFVRKIYGAIKVD
eukprot:gene20450-26535_t